MLANLYEFYNEIGSDFLNNSYIKSYNEVEEYVHIFSHIEWHMKVYLVEVSEMFEGLWVDNKEFLKYPIASAFESCKSFVV